MPDALPDATLPISRLGTGSTNGSNNGGGWGLKNKIKKHWKEYLGQRANTVGSGESSDMKD
jgi:hypothetical protein